MSVITHDIALLNTGIFCPDVKVENGDLVGEVGLQTAVLLSLFTNRFVETDDLPDGEVSNEGWWADQLSEPEDDLIGSIYWTLERETVSDELASRFEDATKDALKWMIDDGVASEVNCTATAFPQQNRINIDMSILRPDGENIPFKFVWDGQEFKSNSGE